MYMLAIEDFSTPETGAVTAGTYFNTTVLVAYNLSLDGKAIEASQEASREYDPFPQYQTAEETDSEYTKLTAEQIEAGATGVAAVTAEGNIIGTEGTELISKSLIIGSDSLKADLYADQQLRLEEEIKYPALYFNPDAVDDTGDGSLAKPYKLVTAARLVAGRRHLIKAGTTITTGSGDIWLSIPATGTEKAPIIIGRYGDSHLPNPIIDGSASAKVIRGSTGAKFWRLRDLEIIGGGAGTNRFGVSQNSVNATGDAVLNFGIVLSNLKIHNVTTDSTNDCNGIKLYGGYNTIIGCEIYNIATDGIWFHGYGTKISGCKVYNVATDGRGAGDCIQCGAKSDGSIVRGNYLNHFEVDIKQCIYFEQTVSISDSVIVEDNYCIHYDGNTNGTSPITCGATNSIVRRNYCKGGAVGIVIGDGGLAYNNVVVQTVGRGIDANTDCGVYYNTIVQTGSDTSQTWSVGIRVTNTEYGVDIKNNLMIGQYNGILGYTVSGSQNFYETNNAFAIRGVSDAKVRVDGTVISPVLAVSDTYSNAFTTLVDNNYRTVSNSLLLNEAIIVSEVDGLDKDKMVSDGTTIGAFI